MESDIGYSAYRAGLVDLRVSAPHVRPQHVICGLLRRPASYDIVVTNIVYPRNPFVVRAWCFAFADGQVNYASGQMENFFGAPQHWPYGLALEPVPAPAGF